VGYVAVGVQMSDKIEKSSVDCGQHAEGEIPSRRTAIKRMAAILSTAGLGALLTESRGWAFPLVNKYCSNAACQYTSVYTSYRSQAKYGSYSSHAKYSSYSSHK
jgi:hypothetical protein